MEHDTAERWLWKWHVGGWKVLHTPRGPRTYPLAAFKDFIGKA